MDRGTRGLKPLCQRFVESHTNESRRELRLTTRQATPLPPNPPFISRHAAMGPWPEVRKSQFLTIRPPRYLPARHASRRVPVVGRAILRVHLTPAGRQRDREGPAAVGRRPARARGRMRRESRRSLRLALLRQSRLFREGFERWSFQKRWVQRQRFQFLPDYLQVHLSRGGVAVDCGRFAATATAVLASTPSGLSCAG